MVKGQRQEGGEELKRTDDIEEIGEPRPVTLSVVKNLLAKRERDGELHYEQKLALEYAKKFARLDQKESEEVAQALMDLKIPRFKERHATKITDILPEDKTALKAIFSKESISLNNEQIDDVLKILSKHRPSGKSN